MRSAGPARCALRSAGVQRMRRELHRALSRELARAEAFGRTGEISMLRSLSRIGDVPPSTSLGQRGWHASSIGTTDRLAGPGEGKRASGVRKVVAL